MITLKREKTNVQQNQNYSPSYRDFSGGFKFDTEYTNQAIDFYKTKNNYRDKVENNPYKEYRYENNFSNDFYPTYQNNRAGNQTVKENKYRHLAERKFERDEMQSEFSLSDIILAKDKAVEKQSKTNFFSRMSLKGKVHMTVYIALTVLVVSLLIANAVLGMSGEIISAEESVYESDLVIPEEVLEKGSPLGEFNNSTITKSETVSKFTIELYE